MREAAFPFQALPVGRQPCQQHPPACTSDLPPHQTLLPAPQQEWEKWLAAGGKPLRPVAYTQQQQAGAGGAAGSARGSEQLRPHPARGLGCAAPMLSTLEQMAKRAEHLADL